MAENNEVKIKISGDSSELKKEYDKILQQSELLRDTLSKAAKISAIAFAGLTAEAFAAVKAFAAQEEAVKSLNKSLANQGILTKTLSKQYQDQAAALQELTGIDDDLIIKGQAVLQGFLGQKQISQELTKATLDLAEATGVDVQTAFSLVGKSIGSSTNALSRYGIEIDATASRSLKIEQLIDAVNGKFKDQSVVANEGLGGVRGLKSAFGDLQEEIGRRLAPIITDLIKGFTIFFNTLKNNKAAVDALVGLGVAAGVLTGLTAILAPLAIGFIKLRAAILAVTATMTGLQIGIRALVGATGIGLLVLLISDLAVNWKERFDQMRAIFLGFTQNIGAVAENFSRLIKAAFTFDVEGTKAAFSDLQESISTAIDETSSKMDEFREQRLAKEQETNALSLEYQNEYNLASAALEQERIDTKKFALQTEQELRLQLAQEEVARINQERKLRLKDEIEFGKSIATIRQVFRSKEFEAAEALSGQLVQLQQSENATLKTIGKAAAVAQIAINTARGATAAFTRSIEAFGVPVGPIVGGALAAAVVAFGVEQTSRVLSAQSGGIVPNEPGRIRSGTDSVPSILTPGELVVPTQSFDEVVNSVAAARAAEGTTGPATGTSTGSQQLVEVIIGFRDNAIEIIEQKLLERRAVGVGSL